MLVCVCYICVGVCILCVSLIGLSSFSFCFSCRFLTITMMPHDSNVVSIRPVPFEVTSLISSVLLFSVVFVLFSVVSVV